MNFRFFSGIQKELRPFVLANTICMGFAIYDWFSNPNSKVGDIGLDLLAHAMNAYNFASENPNKYANILAAGLDILRVGLSREAPYQLLKATDIDTTVHVTSALSSTVRALS